MPPGAEAKAEPVVAARRAAERTSERKVRDMVMAPGRRLRFEKRNQSAAKWDSRITAGISITNVLLPKWVWSCFPLTNRPIALAPPGIFPLPTLRRNLILPR